MRREKLDFFDENLKDYFLFKDNNSKENIVNDVFFKVIRKSAEGVELTFERSGEVDISPID